MRYLLGIFLFLVTTTFNAYAEEQRGVDFTAAKHFKAYKISLQELYANVSIKNHESTDVIVEMEGNEEALKQVLVTPITKHEKTVLAIYHPKKRPIQEAVTITITMPKETITKIGLVGDVTLDVEQIHAPSEISLIGSGKASIAALHDKTELTLIGSSTMQLESIRGKLDADVVGGGALIVKQGYAPYADFGVDGAGEITCGADIFDGKAEVLGAGTITVGGKVRGELRQKMIGAGRIIMSEKPLE